MAHRLLLALVVGFLATMAVSAEERELRALILDGRNYHDWRTTTPILTKILQDTGLFQVDVSTAPPRTGPYGDWHPDFSAYDEVVSNFSDSELWPEPLR